MERSAAAALKRADTRLSVSLGRLGKGGLGEVPVSRGCTTPAVVIAQSVGRDGADQEQDADPLEEAVSYTHLTLPTIYSV